jgi:threonine synthase
VAVDEGALSRWQGEVAAAEGVIICPEAATCVGALEKLVDTGQVGREERVLIVNTAAGQKYFDAPMPSVPQIDLEIETDWEKFEQQFLGQADGKVSGPIKVN